VLEKKPDLTEQIKCMMKFQALEYLTLLIILKSVVSTKIGNNIIITIYHKTILVFLRQKDVFMINLLRLIE